MKNPKQNPDWLHELRLLAEKSPGKGKGKDLTGADPIAMMHELQVRQTELEMQNEELQRSRHELEEWRNKHLELYEFLPLGYAILDKEARILEVNLSGAALLGGERGSVVGRHFQHFIETDSLPEFEVFYNRILESDVKQACELRLVRKDASPPYVHLEGIALCGGEAGVKRCLITVFDITARKQAEESLRESESRYRAIFDGAAEGIFVTDIETRQFYFINPAGVTVQSPPLFVLMFF